MWTHCAGGNEMWPARLPMTKSAVRALDTVTEFMKSEAGGKINVETFMVAGGSKRGWTTWTTAAVDKRVVAIAPMVIDLLNKRPREKAAQIGVDRVAVVNIGQIFSQYELCIKFKTDLVRRRASRVHQFTKGGSKRIHGLINDRLPDGRLRSSLGVESWLGVERYS